MREDDVLADVMGDEFDLDFGDDDLVDLEEDEPDVDDYRPED